MSVIHPNDIKASKITPMADQKPALHMAGRQQDISQDKESAEIDSD